MSHPPYEPLFSPSYLTYEQYTTLSSHPVSKTQENRYLWRFLLTRTKFYARINPYYKFITKHLPGPYLIYNQESSPDNDVPKYTKSTRTLDELPQDVQNDLMPFVSFPKALGPNIITTDPNTDEIIPSERLARPDNAKLNELLLSTISQKSSVGKTYSEHHLLFSAAIPRREKKGFFLLHLAASQPEVVQPFLCVNNLSDYLSKSTEFFTFARDPRPHPTPPLPKTIADYISTHTSPSREHLHLTNKGISNADV